MKIKDLSEVSEVKVLTEDEAKNVRGGQAPSPKQVRDNFNSHLQSLGRLSAVSGLKSFLTCGDYNI